MPVLCVQHIQGPFLFHHDRTYDMVDAVVLVPDISSLAVVPVLFDLQGAVTFTVWKKRKRSNA
jgi:hypothetical protein